MIITQKSSPQKVGAWGEKYVAKLLRPNYKIAYILGADLKVTHRLTGVIFKIEVKTARLSCDGKFRFTLYKKDCTDYHNSDFVVLVALPGLLPHTYLIPSYLIKTNQIVITSHPLTYSGKWSTFRTLNLISTLEGSTAISKR